MAHYAFLDDNNIVTQVIVGKDETDTTHDWELFYGELVGQMCKRTSYNSRGNIYYAPNDTHVIKPPFRKNYAGIGFTYDIDRDAFIPPKPYSSWVMNEFSCLWEAPTPYPNDGQYYDWDETTQSWVKV